MVWRVLGAGGRIQGSGNPCGSSGFFFCGGPSAPFGQNDPDVQSPFAFLVVSFSTKSGRSLFPVPLSPWPTPVLSPVWRASCSFHGLPYFATHKFLTLLIDSASRAPPFLITPPPGDAIPSTGRG